MAHPTYKVNGIKVPSVTTILSRFKESGALMFWAWEQGRDGKDFRETRDAAATAGTLGHSMIESTIRNTPFPEEKDYPPEIWVKSMSSFNAFKEWSRQTQLRPCESEVPLTCACHMLGGCLDAMFIQDKLAIGDFKTSNGIYSDYLLQLAAYGHLWTVNFPDRPITGGYHILRLSKVGGDFAHSFWPELNDAWKMFEHLRAAYDLDKKVKERT
jgi:hypothetical protein